MQLYNDLNIEKQRPSKNRNSLNKRLPRIGRVVFSDQNNAVHCTVKNFSEEKAILTMSGWMGLPSEFMLYVEPDNIRTKCQVSKRKGSNIEVQFTEVEHDIRYRSVA